MDKMEELRKNGVFEILKSVVIETKEGNILTFGDADDYLIDNEDGWLHLQKDGKTRGSILLSRVDSVYINY